MVPQAYEQEATLAEQEEYAEITGAIRSLLEKEAPSLAIAAFRSDVLQALFGVCESDPRKNPMLDLCGNERISIPVFLAMIHKARKRSGKPNCAVFGIGTDSYDFYFLVIDNNSIWSFRYVRWYVGDE
ncbi:hypothetical protein BJX65DRAFT_303837 [Aspergillus insuetus]